MMKNLMCTIALCGLGLTAFSQTVDQKRAMEIARDAIQLMDKGEFAESISKLQQAEKLDPKNFLYSYEIGLAYTFQKDYKNAIKVLKKTIKFNNATYQAYQLLGNALDLDGQPEKAIDMYDKGLAKFPDVGNLYFEKGNVLEVLKKYNEALSAWEKGVEVHPVYPSNYFNATAYFCQYTDERVWGVIYGELFMNLESGSDKTGKISRLLHETYKAAITIKSATEASVSFTKQMQIAVPLEGEEMKLPFPMVYEMTMLMGVIPSMMDSASQDSSKINIQALHGIRTAFVKNWFDSKKDKDYPNILFDRQKQIMDAGHFESYNYWLFKDGNMEEFVAWYETNKESFDTFVDWFNENAIGIDDNNKFYRLQY